MGTSTPTLKTIAENLGLSIGTVQRALHDKGGYSEDTRQAILREAERIGYTANTAASALRSAPITLGVVLPVPEGKNRYFFSYIWQGIERACKDLSIYQIRLVRIYAEPGREEYISALENMLDRAGAPIQGLITVSRNDERIYTLLRRFGEKNIPIFVINSVLNEKTAPPLWFAIQANHQIGQLGADIFTAIHRGSEGNLLLLGGDRKNLLQMARTSDFSQRVSAQCPGISILETHFYHDLPRLKSFIADCLHRFDNIIGLYAVSARETLTACEAVSEAGLSSLPTLVGTDAFPELLPFFKSGVLTASVYQYPTRQSYIAVQMLVSSITKTGRNDLADRFAVVPVFRSTACLFCDQTGLI